MKRYPTNLDVNHLLQIVQDLPTTIDAGNVNMAYDQGHSVNDPNIHPYIRKAIEEIENLTGKRAVAIMINTLDPGQESPIHTDPTAGKLYDRYHLVLATNKDAKWWDARLNPNFLHMAAAFWYGPVPYRAPHKVQNFGQTKRVHLIVDLEEPCLS